MRLAALLFFFLPALVFSETIQDKLFLLRTHDRIVYDFQQSISLIAVERCDADRIELLVATGTKDLLARENLPSWLSWHDHGCPYATSQEKIMLTLRPSVVIQADDPTKVSWLLTLLHLPLTQVPPSGRRKAGPPPPPDELDLRKPWQPPIIINGIRLPIPSTAFSTTWPSDGGSLSNRTLILYFPTSDLVVQALPYWIESPSSSYHISVVDSSSGDP